jgi:hypothetical protein
MSFPLVSSIKLALHLDAVVADVGAAGFNNALCDIAELLPGSARQNPFDLADAKAVPATGEVDALKAWVVSYCAL